MAAGAVHRYAASSRCVPRVHTAWTWQAQPCAGSRNRRAGSHPPRVGDYGDRGSLERDRRNPRNHREIENYLEGSEENERYKETREEMQVWAGSEQGNQAGGGTASSKPLAPEHLPLTALPSWLPSSLSPPPGGLLCLFSLVLIFSFEPQSKAVFKTFYFYWHISGS